MSASPMCLIGIALCAAACGDDAASTTTDTSSGTGGAGGGSAQPGEHRVLPSATDPAIGEPDHEHYAYANEGTANGRLFLFLPGTNQKPAELTFILREAARLGYLVVSVGYPNDAAVAGLCGDDLDCYGEVRQEIIDGTDASPLVTVDAANSISNRANKLLSYLDTTYPDEGWGAFLAGSEVDFANVVVAGHSQGGGHAAFIAMTREVSRVVMFASVVDASAASPPVPATWLTQLHVTPADRYYGFLHTQDPVAPKIEASWTALGVIGPPTSVDSMPPDGSHWLTTSVDVGLASHNSVVTDLATPVDADGPVFAGTWDYLLGP